jgi:oligopeptide/dipeptide ABC transporter ATP-binding protein
MSAEISNETPVTETATTEAGAPADIILSVTDLKMHFPIREGFWSKQVGAVKAVDGVNLEVRRGETLGLVGESGCGKSTFGRCVIRLYEPTEGSIRLTPKGKAPIELANLPESQMRPHRRNIQMIFQDPFACLNPRMTVGNIISEPIRVHKILPKDAIKARVAELMELCGLNPKFIRRYPHEFSGGQRQRIGIARALAADPELIVCDEPISALDVSIQAQIMNLMGDLQKELGLTYVFIAHDLSAVRHISDRIAVMYLGRIVEVADAESLYANPSHPYTKALISAVPIPDPVVEATRERIVLKGDVPSPRNPPAGCRFHTRCPSAYDHCTVAEPVQVTVAGSHTAACHLLDPAAPQPESTASPAE